MSETYTTGGNALQKILFGNETAQSFSPLVGHTLEYIDIDVFLNSERGIPVPHLYNSNPTYEPVGGTASHAISQVYPKPFKPGLQRLRSYMQPYPIEVGKIYCIKIYGLGTTPDYTFFWQYDKDAATYPRGHRIWRDSEFDSYTHYLDQDYMFAEWGNPPLIKPDPIPPVNFFACLGLEFCHGSTSLFLRLATSVPCHLTCYYTDIEPRKHPRTRVVRGATLPWGNYFCFVAWKTEEQIEPGDTLYHTFRILDWSFCQTKWFTFRGEVNNVQSPSIGPIFRKHHSGIGPGVTIEQPLYDTRQEIGYASSNALGQKVVIENRILTKLGAWLSRKGSGGGGTISFQVWSWPGLIRLATKDWGPAGALLPFPNYEEVTLDIPIYLIEQVVILAWCTGHDINNCAYAHYQYGDVKPGENLIHYAAGWVDYPPYDFAYKYTFHC